MSLVFPQWSESATAAKPIETPIDRSTPYPSCPWIEEGLAFNRRSLNSCLIVHHERGYPYLTDFSGGEVDVETVMTARARIIQANQQGGHETCLGCSKLEIRQWPEPAYPFRFLGIAHFSHCNIACDYCFLQWQDPADLAPGYAPYEVLPAIQGLIREGCLAPDVVVDWGGGEPTIHPEFDPVLRLLTEFGATTYIHTNGTRFPQLLEEEILTRRIGIICSIDAGTPETWQRIKGKNLLSTVWRNIRRYISCGCQVTLKYIAMDRNCSEQELHAFVHEAMQAGIKELILDIDYRHPIPSEKVLRGLQRLKYLAVMGGMPVRYGFTGAQFTPEIDVAAEIDEWPDMTRTQRWAYQLKLRQFDTLGRHRVRCLLNRFHQPLERLLKHHQQ